MPPCFYDLRKKTLLAQTHTPHYSYGNIFIGELLKNKIKGETALVCEVKFVSLLESQRELFLDAAKLLFFIGVLVGFIQPFYYIFLNIPWSYYPFGGILASLSRFIFNIIISFIAAFLSLSCYMDVTKGKLKSVVLKGTVASALLIITTWLTGLLVLIGSLICLIYSKK